MQKLKDIYIKPFVHESLWGWNYSTTVVPRYVYAGTVVRSPQSALGLLFYLGTKQYNTMNECI